MRYGAIALLALLVGVGIGGASTPAPETKTRIETRIVTEEVKVPPSEAELNRVRAQVTRARRRVSDARSDLRSVKDDVSSQQHKLDSLVALTSAARTAVRRSTFDGTGTFLVGSDIEPGEYRASASPGCYWSRLSTLDTNDIIDNDNADGPVLVEIAASDKAFLAEDCGTFRKIG